MWVDDFQGELLFGDGFFNDSECAGVVVNGWRGADVDLARSFVGDDVGLFAAGDGAHVEGGGAEDGVGVSGEFFGE